MIKIQQARGTAVQHLTYTGPVGQITIDTTLETVRVHDGVTVGGFPLAQLGLAQVSKTANYTFGFTDIRQLFRCSGAFTLTLAPAANLRAGWWTYVYNEGAGTVSLVPSGADNISGARSFLPGETWMILCDGTSFVTVPLSGNGSLVLAPMTSDTTLYQQDNRKWFDLAGTAHFTLFLDSAANIQAGWYVHVVNTGAGAVVVQPQTGQTISGAASMSVLVGETYLLLCDGSNFTAVPLHREELRPVTQTTGYTLQPADNGKAFFCSGSFTLNTDPAVDCGPGWHAYVYNEGGGLITLAGAALGPGQSCILICDGATFTLLPLSSSGLITYPTPGSYTFTVPVGVYRLWALAIGGGGGGGNGGLTDGGTGGGAAGVTSSAGSIALWAGPIPVSPGQTLTVVVGAGGAPGSAGGLSSVGSTLTTNVGGFAGANGAASTPDGNAGASFHSNVSPTSDLYRLFGTGLPPGFTGGAGGAGGVGSDGLPGQAPGGGGGGGASGMSGGAGGGGLVVISW